MFKLSKTEQKVLASASRSYQGEFTTVQRRGVVSRDLHAVRSLRDKGMMAKKDHAYLEEFSDRTGRETVYLVTHDHITDKGRKLVKVLS